MRFAPVAAASAIALGTLLGAFTASSDAGVPTTVQQRTVASASLTDMVELADNNGNG
ncbi:hypothetical protein OG780_23230 [Streptomyces sp. NBC_00386]|jgi:hypothetical protein|uniref:hypothetical protein n=1 Tax=Streptomyces sp. NBC_00386 TaxID=2975734 RepID=UPI002E1B3F91